MKGRKADSVTTHSLTGHTDQINAAAFSPDGKMLATASRDNTARLWDSHSGKPLHELSGHESYLLAVAFSPNSKTVATGSSDETALLWDTKSGKLLHSLPRRTLFDFFSRGTGPVIAVRFNPKGKMLATASLATASSEGTVRLWDSQGGKLLHELSGHKGSVEAVEFSPDGGMLATVSDDNTARLWDSQSGKLLHSLTGHRSDVRAVAFNPDGRVVATGSFDGSVRFWDVATGQELAALISIKDSADWLVVTPEGLFDGSRRGQELVHFRLPSNDIRDASRIVPVADFFNDFYRPGLLAAIWRGERPLPTANFASRTPPSLRFASLPTGKLSDNEVRVVVEVSDQGGGIGQVSLFVNGAAFAALESVPSKDGKTLRKTYLVQLQTGDNRLEARATGAGKGSWDNVASALLSYDKPLERPRLFVLAVGVGKFADGRFAADPRIRPLKYPAADAQTVSELFKRRGKVLYESVEVITLTDAQATRKAIEDAFARIAKQARAQDTLLLYLSGHGKKMGQIYYYPSYEVQKDEVASKALQHSDLLKLIIQVPAQKRLWVLDTCYSGLVLELARVTFKSDEQMQWEAARLMRSSGTYILTACGAEEEAAEVEELKHGLLTYALLASLNVVKHPLLTEKGIELKGGHRVAELDECVACVSRAVRELSRHYYRQEQDLPTYNYELSMPLLPLKDPNEK